MSGIYRFEPCTFLEAVEALTKGLRIRISTLPPEQYFIETNEKKVFLCEPMTPMPSNLIHDRILRRGLALMGSEQWERQAITSWQTCFKATNNYGCGLYLIEAYLRESVERDGVKPIPAGSRVLLWTSSRFGDVGITANVSKEATGYDYRVDPSLLTHPRVFDWDSRQEVMYLEEKD